MIVSEHFISCSTSSLLLVCLRVCIQDPNLCPDCSVYMTEKKGKIRKEMNEHDNEMGACFTEALLNYETVGSPDLHSLPSTC